MTAALFILDCPCVPVPDEAAAIAELAEHIGSGRGGYAAAINAEKILFYRSRPDLRAVIDDAALPYPDGFGAVIGLKWLHGVRASKINMPIAALEGAEACGWRVFVLGGSEEVNAAAAAEIVRRYPRVKLAGRLNGYEPEAARFATIAAAKPDLVMAALGSPRQELFAARLVEQLPGVFVVGCGGALDILAGRIRRAPKLMIDNGLEWLYRLVKEPHRWRRQKVLPLYLARLAVEALRPASRQSSDSK